MWRTSLGLLLTTAMAIVFYDISSVVTPWEAKTGVAGEDVVRGNICLTLAIPATVKVVHMLTRGNSPLRETPAGALRLMVAPFLSGAVVAPLVYLLSAALTSSPSLSVAYGLSLLAVGPHAAESVLAGLKVGHVPSLVEQGKRSVSLLLGNGGRMGRNSRLLSRSAMGVLLGAWAGSVVVPLDWERGWQVFPTPALVGGVCGLGMTGIPLWVGGGAGN